MVILMVFVFQRSYAAKATHYMSRKLIRHGYTTLAKLMEPGAVESAIHALEAHRLNQCPDHGFSGFKRCVSLAVLARKIKRLGVLVLEQEKEREKRKRGPYKKRPESIKNRALRRTTGKVRLD